VLAPTAAQRMRGALSQGKRAPAQHARLTGTGARDTSAGPNGPAPGCPDYIFTLTRILGTFIGSDGDDEVPFQLPVRNSSKPATTGNRRTRTGQSETNRVTTGVASRYHRTRRASAAEARSDRPTGPMARHSLPAAGQARIFAFALSLLVCERISRPLGARKTAETCRGGPGDDRFNAPASSVPEPRAPGQRHQQ
jgi:hypothetical protein